MDVLNEFPLVDEHGKRYREFGRGCREYAPTIVTTAGTVPAGTVICKHTEPEAITPKKDCPFQGGLYPRCTEDCSFYANSKCKPGTAQAGKRYLYGKWRDDGARIRRRNAHRPVEVAPALCHRLAREGRERQGER